MNAKQWIKENKELSQIIIAVLTLSFIVAMILLIHWLMTRNKKFHSPTPELENSGIKVVNQTFGNERAKTVEQIYRWETAQFNSRGYKNTNGPGMEATRDGQGKVKPYPHGWTSLDAFWSANPNYKPIGVYTTPENGTGIVKPFLIFATPEAGMMTLATWLQTHRPGNWYSTNPDLQQNYENDIAQVTPKIANTLS